MSLAKYVIRKLAISFCVFAFSQLLKFNDFITINEVRLNISNVFEIKVNNKNTSKTEDTTIK